MYPLALVGIIYLYILYNDFPFKLLKGLTFKTKMSLTQEFRDNTSQFKCIYCWKSFSQKIHLETHSKTCIIGEKLLKQSDMEYKVYLYSMLHDHLMNEGFSASSLEEKIKEDKIRNEWLDANLREPLKLHQALWNTPVKRITLKETVNINPVDVSLLTPAQARLHKVRLAQIERDNQSRKAEVILYGLHESAIVGMFDVSLDNETNTFVPFLKPVPEDIRVKLPSFLDYLE